MDDLVKQYIDYRISKNLPELSREEVFALVDFNTWQEKHSAQHSVQRIGDGLCANCGESKTLVVCKECLNELVANR